MELIRITTNEQGSQVVSARELHNFMEVKTEFVKWCKRMFEYGFQDKEDYVEVFAKNGENLTGGRPSVDYVLTLDCAKEIAMLQRSEKGKQARQYFIECEKRLRNPSPQPVAELSRKDLALMVLKAEEEKEVLQQQLAVQAPKVEYVDEVLSTDECVTTSVIASELGYSAVAFNKLLHGMGIQRQMDGTWILTSKYMDRGYTQMRTHLYHDSEGKPHSRMYMVWTQRGRAFLHWIMKQQGQTQQVS